ncbi:MAG: DNA-3-methyladenine glycosylase [Verrucomicrobia bacterium]|nr:DNA-3-methyladenine glycosylase [Verrucomicrobiota bacterium]
MRRVIKAKVLQGKKTVALARWLIGKHLVRRHAAGRLEARMITEVEAYDGERDLACHARAGRTRRTEVMYAPGGVWYVYLCYGVHEMLNLVVGPRGRPAAVLIRGVEGASGPGRVTKALGIGRALNGAAARRASGLWIEDRGVRVPRRLVQATPRIGVAYAGPIWAKKPWRFVLTDHKCSASAVLIPHIPNPRAERPRSLGGD